MWNLEAIIYTLPETNIAPENGWLDNYFPIGMAYFQVLCLFEGGYIYIYIIYIYVCSSQFGQRKLATIKSMTACCCGSNVKEVGRVIKKLVSNICVIFIPNLGK